MPPIARRFYVVETSARGDYERIGAHGMTSHLPLRDGRPQLERLGPEIPPISLPGRAPVVTAAVRAAIESWDIGESQFSPVDKAWIPRFDWRAKVGFLLTASPSGEPEDIILSRPHDATAAAEMPDVFTWIAPFVPGRSLREIGEPQSKLRIDTIETPPVFMLSRRGGRLIVTDEGRDRLTSLDPKRDLAFVSAIEDPDLPESDYQTLGQVPLVVDGVKCVGIAKSNLLFGGRAVSVDVPLGDKVWSVRCSPDGVQRDRLGLLPALPDNVVRAVDEAIRKKLVPFPAAGDPPSLLRRIWRRWTR